MLSAIKSKVTLNAKEILFINNTYQRFFIKGLQVFISSPKDNKNASLSEAFLLSFRLLTYRVLSRSRFVEGGVVSVEILSVKIILSKA